MVWFGLVLSELDPRLLLVLVPFFSRLNLVMIWILSKLLLGPVISLPLGDGFDFL